MSLSIYEMVRLVAADESELPRSHAWESDVARRRNHASGLVALFINAIICVMSTFI